GPLRRPDGGAFWGQAPGRAQMPQLYAGAVVEYQTPEFHPAFEEYCEAIWELKEDDVDVIQARVAERLGVSRPAGCAMIQRVQGEAFCSLDGTTINLTKDGVGLAEQVVRRHRLAERLLTDILGLPGADAHVHAGKGEHTD